MPIKKFVTLPLQWLSKPMQHVRDLWLILLIIVVTFTLYGQTLNHDFVNFDDDGYIYLNSYVKSGISIRGLIYAFTTTDKGNWIPLTWLSLMLDFQLFRLNPMGYHFNNVLLHALNASLLFIFFKKITGDTWPSLISSILFIIHPLHVESVAWLSERKDLLCAFFCFSSLISYSYYIEKPNYKNYILVSFLYLLALLSKPMAITLPMIMLLLDFWPLKRIEDAKNLFKIKNNRLLIIEKIPLIIISFLFSVITVISQKNAGAMVSIEKIPILVRCSNALESYIGYIIKTIYPVNLAVIYPYQKLFNISQIFFDLIIIVIISYIAGTSIKKYPYLFIGWLWFLITLLPVIGLIQVGNQSMADRYTYLPLIGLFIVIVWYMKCLTTKFQVNQYIITIISGILLFVFGLISWNQIKIWKNSVTLFEHTVTVTKNNWLAHLNLGEAFYENGQTDEAIIQYQKALAINPSFDLAYLNIGTALSQKGRIEDSIAYYQKALQEKKTYQMPGLT